MIFQSKKPLLEQLLLFKIFGRNFGCFDILELPKIHFIHEHQLLEKLLRIEWKNKSIFFILDFWGPKKNKNLDLQLVLLDHPLCYPNSKGLLQSTISIHFCEFQGQAMRNLLTGFFTEVFNQQVWFCKEFFQNTITYFASSIGFVIAYTRPELQSLHFPR